MENLTDYYTFWVIVVILYFVFGVVPFFRSSYTRWKYRDDIFFAIVIWVITFISLGFYLELTYRV